MRGDIFIDNGGQVEYIGTARTVTRHHGDFMGEFEIRGVVKYMPHEKLRLSNMKIDRVIFNNPATIVLWKDGTKTVVKCQKGDKYSEEVGLAMCICKKALGNTGAYNEIFKKFVPEKPKAEVREVVLTGNLRKLSPEEEEKFRKEHGMEEKPHRGRKSNIDIGKIKALHRAGWSAKDIADDMGISTVTVYKYLEKRP